MVTFIRTLKKVTSPTKPSESSPLAAPTQQHDLTALVLPPLVYYSQLRKTKAAATGVAKMNKKSSSAPSNDTTSPAPAAASADTSDVTTATHCNGKRKYSSVDDELAVALEIAHITATHCNGKRKSSSVDDELAVALEIARIRREYKRRNKSCSADGCTNYAQRGGVCIRHGAKKKRCGVEGCTNQLQQGGVCKRHGAKVELRKQHRKMHLVKPNEEDCA